MPRKINVANLQDVIDLAAMENRWYKPSDFPRNVLILKDAQRKVGDRGEYFLLTCVLEASGETVDISTGATQPSATIKAWLSLGKPSVRFSFHFENDRILMGEPVGEDLQTPMFTDEELKP